MMMRKNNKYSRFWHLLLVPCSLLLVTCGIMQDDLSLARLVSHDDARSNARFVITNREDGHEVVNIDLCYYLALARTYFELHNYGIQEYLDREYDYRLDFGFERKGDHDVWKYMTIRIDVLSWVLRIQNEEL